MRCQFFFRRGDSADYALLKYMKEFQYAIKEIIGKDVDAKDFVFQPLWGHCVTRAVVGRPCLQTLGGC